MELKVSRVKSKSKNDNHVLSVDNNENIMPYTDGDIGNLTGSDLPLERYSVSADIDLCRQKDNYYIAIDNKLLSITEQEAVAIYEHPENVYDIILDKTRKFHFSASEDNLNITIGNM